MDKKPANKLLKEVTGEWEKVIVENISFGGYSPKDEEGLLGQTAGLDEIQEIISKRVEGKQKAACINGITMVILALARRIPRKETEEIRKIITIVEDFVKLHGYESALDHFIPEGR